MTNIIVHGCYGRMGRCVCQMAEDANVSVAAGVDANASTQSPEKFPIFAKISDCGIPADVIVDFSNPAAVPALLAYASAKKIPVVLCTTGLSDEETELVMKAAEQIPIFKSANMSVGVAYLMKAVKDAAAFFLDAGFDAEIIEKHHNQKIDAPSGTALLLADAVNDAAGGMEYVCSRAAVRKPRGKKEIGIHSMRGGTIVGEHTVIFAGHSETLEFTHKAESREVFAAGALNAAKFLAGKEPGLYDMNQMIKG